MTLTKSLCHDNWGWYAEAHDSETDYIGRWYGTKEECEAVPISAIDIAPPRDSDLDQFDLACERRHDG